MLNCALCMNSTYCETCLPGEVFISAGKCGLNNTNNNANKNISNYTNINNETTTIITKFATVLN